MHGISMDFQNVKLTDDLQFIHVKIILFWAYFIK